MNLLDTLNARFAETAMPPILSTAETHAINAMLKDEWVLIHDRRTTPPGIFAFPADMSPPAAGLFVGLFPEV